MSKRFKISLATAIVVILAIATAQMVIAVEEEPGPWFPPTLAGIRAACLASASTARWQDGVCYLNCPVGWAERRSPAASLKWNDGKTGLKLEWYTICKPTTADLVCSNLSKPLTIQSGHTLPYTFSWKCQPGPVTSATLRILVDKARMQWVEIPLTLSADGMSGTVMGSSLPTAGKYWLEVIITNPRDRFKLSGGAMIIE